MIQVVTGLRFVVSNSYLWWLHCFTTSTCSQVLEVCTKYPHSKFSIFSLHPLCEKNTSTFCSQIDDVVASCIASSWLDVSLHCAMKCVMSSAKCWLSCGPDQSVSCDCNAFHRSPLSAWWAWGWWLLERLRISSGKAWLANSACSLNYGTKLEGESCSFKSDIWPFSTAVFYSESWLKKQLSSVAFNNLFISLLWSHLWTRENRWIGIHQFKDEGTVCW